MSLEKMLYNISVVPHPYQELISNILGCFQTNGVGNIPAKLKFNWFCDYFALVY